jgi:hypothetical protein
VNQTNPPTCCASNGYGYIRSDGTTGTYGPYWSPPGSSTWFKHYRYWSRNTFGREIRMKMVLYGDGGLPWAR